MKTALEAGVLTDPRGRYVSDEVAPARRLQVDGARQASHPPW